ncbi:hypothetical protein NDU88_003588 [Pleurodeles waltl]|uniref:Uncharacterized protein n=1 Tax=Pleurodeles waltl TaxID=8319 RepID=A0AAV7RHV4_PLEWA|nr:hypothetical protein NDU88_003588 [Pleurodeles waltl]
MKLEERASVDDIFVPVTQLFMEALFTKFHEDIAVLWDDMVVGIKEDKKDVTDLGNRVAMMETGGYALEEELESRRWELLELREHNLDLQLHMEDLENRLRQSNIHINGVPPHSDGGYLEGFVICLFHHVHPEVAEKEIVIDHTHTQ